MKRASELCINNSAHIFPLIPHTNYSRQNTESPKTTELQMLQVCFDWACSWSDSMDSEVFSIKKIKLIITRKLLHTFYVCYVSNNGMIAINVDWLFEKNFKTCQNTRRLTHSFYFLKFKCIWILSLFGNLKILAMRKLYVASWFYISYIANYMYVCMYSKDPDHASQDFLRVRILSKYIRSYKFRADNLALEMLK